MADKETKTEQKDVEGGANATVDANAVAAQLAAAQAQQAAIEKAAKEAAEAAEVKANNELRKRLREQLNILGISVAPNAGVEAMLEALTSSSARQVPVEEVDLVQEERIERRRIRDEQTALVRLRITNLNPAKTDLHGEIFTVSNDIIGTVSKYVPYVDADDGYHLPRALYEMLKEKEFLQIKEAKKGSRKPAETRLVREFSFEELEPLTEAEIAEIAAAQKAD